MPPASPVMGNCLVLLKAISLSSMTTPEGPGQSAHSRRHDQSVSAVVMGVYV